MDTYHALNRLSELEIDLGDTHTQSMMDYKDFSQPTESYTQPLPIIHDVQEVKMIHYHTKH